MLRSALPLHLRPRREKVFGDGPRIPLDREAKVRIMHLARALKHRTEPRKHYGALTGKFVDILNALLWLIHDGRSGQCNPAYATMAVVPVSPVLMHRKAVDEGLAGRNAVEAQARHAVHR